MLLAFAVTLLTRASILAAATAVVVPATAQAAPALSPLKPCYVSVSRDKRQVLDAVAIGFTPNAEVDVTVGGRTHKAVANGAGTVNLTRTAAPYRRRGQRRFTVTATEPGNPANSVSESALVTALSVHLRPREAATSDRVRFIGRGFTSPRPIWGHYLTPRGRVRKTVRLADGPESICGAFQTRLKQIPIRHPRPGRWTLQVDQQRRWSPHPDSVFVPVMITVQRVVGP